MSRSHRATPRSSPPPRSGRRADLLRDLAALLGFVVACLAVGGLGALATSSSVATWYPTLHKPDWTPPAWVFGPVWTTLYVLIGFAGWLVWRAAHSRDRARSLGLWWGQLVLNGLWSPLFFGLRSPAAGLVTIVALGASIVAFVLAARRVSRPAAALFVPYAMWVGFATALNAAIVWLARSAG